MKELAGIPFKIGNGSKGFEIVANDVSARAIGRSLPHLPHIVSVLRTTLTDSTGKKFSAHEATYSDGTVRTAVWHTVKATANATYVLDFDAATNTFVHGTDDSVNQGRVVKSKRLAAIDSAWADGQEHMAVSVFVQNVNEQTGRLGQKRLSRGSMPQQYKRFAKAQAEAGITPEDPRYVHPVEHWPKDVYAALLFLLKEQQSAIALKHVKEPTAFFNIVEEYELAEAALTSNSQ
jgi:hypothetical protein